MAAIQEMHGEISVLFIDPSTPGGGQQYDVGVAYAANRCITVSWSGRCVAARLVPDTSPSHPSANRSQERGQKGMMDISRAVARAWTLMAGIRGGDGVESSGRLIAFTNAIRVTPGLIHVYSFQDVHELTPVSSISSVSLPVSSISPYRFSRPDCFQAFRGKRYNN